MGEWERKSDTLWMYRLTGAARPYGSVVQFKDTRNSDPVWEATVTAARLDDDTTIAERVSLDEAKAAIERHAADHVDHA